MNAEQTPTADDFATATSALRTLAYLMGRCFDTTSPQNLKNARIRLAALRDEFTEQPLFALVIDDFIAGIEKRNPPI